MWTRPTRGSSGMWARLTGGLQLSIGIINVGRKTYSGGGARPGS